MDFIQVLDEYEKIIDKQDSLLFAQKTWINDRKKDWNNNKLRVGVVGVTSSGKSTLINAILGLDILSSAVEPSSNQLVCCTYGKEKKCIIKFVGNQPDLILVGKDFNQETIKKYSDERFNRNNEKNVASIEIQSPYFELSKDIVLIDSPGLDAHGCEEHERITLQCLIPMIDVCIYVTTLKTNSDAKTFEVLKTIASYGCPVIVVQNMLDSVRPSPDGKKSRKEVAKEHIIRLKRIIKESDIPNKENVYIAQMTATYAKKWRMYRCNNQQPPQDLEKQYKESGYAQFVAKAKDCIDKQKPRINNQRYKSITKDIQKTLDLIDGLIKNKKNQQTEIQAFNVEQTQNEVKLFSDNLEKDISKLLDVNTYGVETHFKEVEQNISPANIDQYINNTNKIISKMGEDICKYIKNSNHTLIKWSELVNIPNRDINMNPQMSYYSQMSAENYTVLEDEKVEIEGKIFPKIQRFFGNILGKDWGYETKTIIKKDINKAKEDIYSTIKNAHGKYQKSVEGWLQGVRKVSIPKIRDTLEIIEKQYKVQLASQKQLEDLLRIGVELRELKKNIALEETSSINTTLDIEEEQNNETVEVEVTDIFSNVMNLSKNCQKMQHISITKTFVKKENLLDYIPIVLGWDKNSMDYFLWNLGINDCQKILLPEDKPPEERDYKNTCFFVLVNAIQMGAAKNKIEALRLFDIAEPNDYVIWVVQDFEELIHGDDIEDGLNNMLGLTIFSQIACKSIVWISHENPIYNIAFLEQQKNPIRDISEEPQFIKDLKIKYPEYCSEEAINIIAKYMMKVRVE